MSNDPVTRRPGTVTAAAVILFGCAGLQLVLGVVAAIAIDLEDAAPALLLLVAFALVAVVLATKVLGGGDGARTTVIVLLASSAALQVLSDAAIENKIVAIGLNLLVIGLLVGSRAARRYFDHHRDPAPDARPGTVTAAATILYVHAGILLFIGLLTLFTDAGYAGNPGPRSWGALLVGVAELVLATGVLRGSSLARVVLVVLATVIAINTDDEDDLAAAVLSLVVVGLVLRAGNYFRGSRWWVTSSPGGRGS